MPEISIPEAVVIVGLVFAVLVFWIARAYFED